MNPVETVDACLQNIEVQTFVAVNLSNYNKMPVTAKVLEVNEEKIKIHYWKGTFKGKWSPQNVPRTWNPWVDELPKDCVILCSFSLQEESKLFPSTRKHLQDKHAKLKQKD